MDAAALLKLAISASILLIVFSIGLHARLDMALGFLKRPDLAVKAMISMFVVMPAFVIISHLVFGLASPLPATLLAFAVSPMPPILPRKELKAGADVNYVIGLQVIAVLVALPAAALVYPLAAHFSGSDIDFPEGAVFGMLLKTIVAPLVIGMVVNHLAPTFAAKFAKPVGLVGSVLLLIVSLVLLVKFWPAIVAVAQNGTVLWVAAMVAVALLVGHLLGGPHEGNRSALAVATAARHPGVALAIAMSARPDAGPQIIGVVLIYLLANAILTIPYMRWRASKED